MTINAAVRFTKFITFLNYYLAVLSKLKALLGDKCANGEFGESAHILP